MSLGSLIAASRLSIDVDEFVAAQQHVGIVGPRGLGSQAAGLRVREVAPTDLDLLGAGRPAEEPSIGVADASGVVVRRCLSSRAASDLRLRLHKG